MSNRQNKSKPMSISDISKRMITRSQIREQSSTSVPNPPKVTNTEPINTMIDSYSRTVLPHSLEQHYIYIYYTMYIYIL